jgi:hypothetical protein
MFSTENIFKVSWQVSLLTKAVGGTRIRWNKAWIEAEALASASLFF